MSGNYRQSETNVLSNNKILLNLLQSITFRLIHVTVNIQNVLLWLECRRLVDGIVNNALFHSNSHISQMPPQIIYILRFFSGRLAAPDFVMKCIKVLFNGQKSESSYGSLTLLHFRSEGSDRIMHRMSG